MTSSSSSLYTIICYSHTDYLDILNVQNSYLQKYPEEKILLINENIIKNTPEYINATSCFQQILYYNDSLNYSKRIFTSLNKINMKTKHIIFFHDMDILYQKKQENIIKIIEIMNNNNIHRVDFQNWYNETVFDDIIPAYDNVTIRKTLSDGYYYNVNPAIWCSECFLDLMNNIDKNYREIELEETQIYCKSKYNFYRLFDETNIKFTILYRCTDTFIPFHISNWNSLVNPYSKLNYKGIDYNFGEEYINEYVKILRTFTFNPNRHIHPIKVY
jgi:hypothetical protein